MQYSLVISQICWCLLNFVSFLSCHIICHENLIWILCGFISYKLITFQSWKPQWRSICFTSVCMTSCGKMTCMATTMTSFNMNLATTSSTERSIGCSRLRKRWEAKNWGQRYVFQIQSNFSILYINIELFHYGFFSIYFTNRWWTSLKCFPWVLSVSTLIPLKMLSMDLLWHGRISMPHYFIKRQRWGAVSIIK